MPKFKTLLFYNIKNQTNMKDFTTYLQAFCTLRFNHTDIEPFLPTSMIYVVEKKATVGVTRTYKLDGKTIGRTNYEKTLCVMTQFGIDLMQAAITKYVAAQMARIPVLAKR